jgi:hypothetical protein
LYIFNQRKAKVSPGGTIVPEEGKQMADIEEVGLDWRFGIPLEFARITLRELKRFYDEGEKQFATEIAKLEMQAKGVSADDDDQMDYLGDVRDQREGIVELNREFAIVGIFRTFERFLRLFLDPRRHPGFAIPAPKGSRLKDLEGQYKAIGVDLTRLPFEWRDIKKLQEIRNCITHDEGWIDAKRAGALRSYQFPVKENDWIELPEDYFVEAYNLVQRTCRLVIEECRKAAKDGRMKMQSKALSTQL